MSTVFECTADKAHSFKEGTPQHAKASEMAENAARLVFCPECSATLVPREDVLPRDLPQPQRDMGLVMIAADVSASMFEKLDSARSKIEVVAVSLAQLLSELCGSSTSKSLLVGILAFGEQALWIAPSDSRRLVGGPAPTLMTAPELCSMLLEPGAAELTPKERQKSLEKPLLALLTFASEACGTNGTSFTSVLQMCDSVIAQVVNDEDASARTVLRKDWNRLRYDGKTNTPLLRTILYSDGLPNRDSTSSEELATHAHCVFAERGVSLVTASFCSPSDGNHEHAEAILRMMSSVCPDPRHGNARCTFPTELAGAFSTILRMASLGYGHCVQCLKENSNFASPAR